ncbi:hypothetical protein BGZ81_002196 [Podila clonocystis]|nr:hypothetical protein BGZ81_002196 [Podila clonocystis]
MAPGAQSSPNSSFAPPRASFSSSSRASPVGHSKSGRGDRDREDQWQDITWRNIFDAALVKAQQAVQLDELQETTLAANLYAQAANDLDRVIPMCTSEKKKQSMLAIQAIYLDRVTQLREAEAKKETAGQQKALVSQALDANINKSHDGGYRRSVSINRPTVDQEDIYQPQQYAHHPQQQRSHPQSQIYQAQSHQQLQQQQLQYQQQIQQLQLQQQQLQLQQQQLFQPPPPPQQESSEKGGFRLFGKKRSKTQPSSPHPPLFLQSSQDQLYDSNNNASDYIHYSERSNGSENTGYIASPYMAPQTISASESPMVSPICVTNPPPQSSIQAAVQPLNDMLDALDGPVRPSPEPSATPKSSKWRPFGKKKSKSVSAKIETNMSSPNLFASNDPNNNKSHANLGHHTPEIHQQPHGMSQTFLPPPLQHPQLNQVDQAPAQVDWYVGNKESSDEFDKPDRCLDDEDEDVDPYYIADTKGRATAFEGKDSEKKKKKKKKDKNGKKPKEEAKSPARKPLISTPSSYSQDKTFSPTFSPVAAYSPIARYGQDEEYEERLKSLEEDEAYRQQYITNDTEQSLHYQEADQNPGYEYQPALDHREDGEPFVHEVQVSETLVQEAVKIVEPEPEPEHQSSHAVELQVNPEPEHDYKDVNGDDAVVSEKTKTRRTWYGKKKKEKEKDKEKDKDKEEKEKEKEKERARDVARLMDEALFGGPIKKASKNLDEALYGGPIKKASKNVQEQSSNDTKPVEPVADEDELRAYNDEVDVDNLRHLQDESTISSTRAPVTESLHNSEIQDLESASASQIILPENEQDAEALESAQKTEIDSGTLKRSKSRHFSIFRGKKKLVEPLDEEPQQDGGVLTTIVTNDDDKSIHSHATRKSSVHGPDRRAAAEMAAALAVRPKDTFKRKSDEYVPYEYQEDLEGPLMERVPVPENREIIGFVLPVEEIIDYNAEGNEEAALDNWDSWVSQLESFEKVLSNKGLKKEKSKKAKKEKESKDANQDQNSPMGSLKNNRSSIFGLGRSDTVRSRPGSTLDLNSYLLDSRPLSMSTTLLDDASIAPRQSFQSSRSGGSEAPSQMMIQPQVKKRWWKRKETPSVYRASNTYSTADLDQDRHLSTLLQAQDQVRSNEDMTLETTITSMPVIVDEPVEHVVPAKEFLTAKIPVVESVAVEQFEKPKVTPKVTPNETTLKEPEQESESEPVAPMPKLKAKKSIKPKLLPISTPLPQLLKIENAEELWQYVQQAKTYATSRMNKGDKRSAAIALKRAQALEARWQEILLEMASSGEDTDEILEDDDDEDESEESSEEEVVIQKKKKQAEDKKSNRESLEIVASAPAELTVETKVVTPTTPTPSNKPPTPLPTVVSTVKTIQFEDDDEDEEERNYAASRRRSISRSNSTPDKYSKYKVNKTASPPTSGNSSKSLAILSEDVSDDTKTATKSAPVDDGRLGPEATLEQLLESTNVEHVKYYIQRMKTDTVAKARNGSKFAALEGMKNVKVLQQHLVDLQAPPPPPLPVVLSTVSETIVEEDEEEEKEEEEVKQSSDVVVIKEE